MIISQVNFIKNLTKIRLDSFGVPPFTWDIKKGEGNLVTEQNHAFFTSPNKFSGSTVIQCTDSNGDQVSTEISYGSALMVVLNVIQKELSLKEDQIHISFQDNKLKNDKRPYIVGRINPMPFSNVRKDHEGEVSQVLMINGQVSIDILGFTNEVSFLAPRIIMALKSRYAEKQQMINGIKIYSLPTAMLDISQAEGPSGLIRYNMTFNLTYSELSLSEDSYFENIETNLIVRQ